MKRFAISAVPIALFGVAGAAHAQSSLTLYGLLDDSIRYVSNSGGHALWATSAGIQGNRWGLKGSEDLGGNLKTIFQLENGFNLNTGALGQGGRMFGRQAYVGLSSPAWGTVTVGRQYDSVADLVQPLTGDRWGTLGTTPGDVDNNDSSARISNAVKYVSPTVAGLKFNGMYALGGVAGAMGAGQTLAAAASYNTGALTLAAGYLRMDNTTPTAPGLRTGWSATSDGTFDGGFQNIAYPTAKSISIVSTAAQYVAGPVTVGVRYSNAQYKPDANSAFSTTERYNVAGALVNYQMRPDVFLGAGYTFTRGGGDASATYNQVTLIGDYFLSKRSDVYVIGGWQRASGTQRNGSGALMPAIASVGDSGYNSSSGNQVVVSLGMRHRF